MYASWQKYEILLQDGTRYKYQVGDLLNQDTIESIISTKIRGKRQKLDEAFEYEPRKKRCKDDRSTTASSHLQEVSIQFISASFNSHEKSVKTNNHNLEKPFYKIPLERTK